MLLDWIFLMTSQLIIFKGLNDVPNPDIFINNVKLNAVTSVNHLGQTLHKNINVNHSSKCVNDFHVQFNCFKGVFKH